MARSRKGRNHTGSGKGGKHSKITRLDFERREEAFLASYAMKSSETLGRKHPEKEHEYRTSFQRDRDRIIHCTAFRRLEYKTQVFVNHEGDHYRTRLTHTLETCQVSRTVARVLGLNEDLVEAIALAHDIGHGPFGHAGEWALLDLMRDHGGFEHNVQALRIVEELEDSYAAFPGLNLTHETLEGMKKHPEKFYKNKKQRLRTLEADLVDLGDEIAYNTHDLDDGLRAGLITEDQVRGLKLWDEAQAYVSKKLPKLSDMKRRMLIIRLIVNRLVNDVIQTSLEAIERHSISSVSDLQKMDKPVIAFSKEVAKYHRELKSFLHHNLYQHYRVVRMTDKGQRFLKAIFNVYLQRPETLPPDICKDKKNGKYRSICDYVAGMTDRFALDEYKRLFEAYERV